EHGVEAHVLAQDLLQAGAVQAVLAEVERRGLTVEWLVNNAGFGTGGRFDQLPVEHELEEVRLNVEALVEFTGRCLPGMVARRRDTVLVNGFMNSLATTTLRFVPRSLVARATAVFMKGRAA